MKSRISFAEVLKKKGKSPKIDICPQQGFSRLADIIAQYEVHPEEDYTLYLGNMGISQKSRPNSIRMFCSKNTVDEEPMFDSWIQKQSYIANKENIRDAHQLQKKTNENHFNKTQTQHKLEIQKTGQSKDGPFRQIGKGMTQMTRDPRIENKQLNLQKYHTNDGQQTMKSQQEQQNNNYIQIHNKTTTFKDRIKNHEHTNDVHKHQKNQGSLSNKEVKERYQEETSKRQVNSYKQPIDESANRKVNQQDSKKNKILDQIMAQTEHIVEEIEEMAMEIIKEKQNKVVELQEDQLLIQDSDKKPIQIQNQKLPNFPEKFPHLVDEDFEKKRKQQAKSVIQTYLSNMQNKGRSYYQEHKPYVAQKQTKIQRHDEIDMGVGYSFASNNLLEQNNHFESNTRNIIPQIQSEFPSEAVSKNELNESSDIQFRRKYISNIIVPDEHIKNIESVNYGKVQGEKQVQNTELNHIKLIRSQSNDQHRPILQSQSKYELKPEITINIQQSHQEKDINISNSVKQPFSETSQLIGKASPVALKQKYAVAHLIPKEDLSPFQIQGSKKQNQLKPSTNIQNNLKSNEPIDKSDFVENIEKKIENASAKPTNTELKNEIKESRVVQNCENLIRENTKYLQLDKQNHLSPEVIQKIQINNISTSPFKTIKDVKDSVLSQVKSPTVAHQIQLKSNATHTQPLSQISANSYNIPTYTVSSKYISPKTLETANIPYTNHYQPTSFEYKAIDTSPYTATYQTKNDKSKKNDRFEKLDIKESINFDDKKFKSVSDLNFNFIPPQTVEIKKTEAKIMNEYRYIAPIPQTKTETKQETKMDIKPVIAVSTKNSLKGPNLLQASNEFKFEF